MQTALIILTKKVIMKKDKTIIAWDGAFCENS